jgi:CHAT domain-containing protein
LDLLPGSRKEVSYIGHNIYHVADNDVVLGSDFTKKRIEDPVLSQYRIVHFATHGLLPTDLSCQPEPAIILSVDPKDRNANAGFLMPNDILGLTLNSDLVVLSACNTGRAGDSSSENLSVLAQSFFQAQARGLLVTHWELSDASGPLMSSLALRGSKGGEDSATALQKAKLAFIREIAASQGNKYSHPYHWAPFVLIGDGTRRVAAG